MKIALPHEYGHVNQHFGRSREFAVIEADGEKILSQKIISAESLQHNHEGLAGLMQKEGIDVVIVGGIGARALAPLKENGLEVITGASGKIAEVVGRYLRGELVSSTAVCSHHHGDHDHGCHH
jgi:predicted Fe-Mo cluster-binding NifX family protein